MKTSVYRQTNLCNWEGLSDTTANVTKHDACNIQTHSSRFQKALFATQKSWAQLFKANDVVS